MIVNRLAELTDYGFDGLAAFEAALSQSSYGSLHQAIASLTLFTHPLTVKRLGPANVFRAIRITTAHGANKGDIVRTDEGTVMVDDNQSPIDTFKWVHGWTSEGRDVQYNHIYQASDRVRHYTNLRNICVSPAFLAKLTDTHREITELLKYRAYHLYKYTGPNDKPPAKPHLYDGLSWAAPLPSVDNPIEAVAARMKRSPRSRTTRSTSELGWAGAPT